LRQTKGKTSNVEQKRAYSTYLDLSNRVVIRPANEDGARRSVLATLHERELVLAQNVLVDEVSEAQNIGAGHLHAVERNEGAY
jgi:hypothetical protein